MIEKQTPQNPEAKANLIEMPDHMKRELADLGFTGAREPQIGKIDPSRVDTSKVIGHPDNMADKMTAAYAKELDSREHTL